MYRYCDDLVICCKKRDAERITKSLQGRMERFSLKINEDKTKVVAFEKTRVKVQRQGNLRFSGVHFLPGDGQKRQDNRAEAENQQKEIQEQTQSGQDMV